MDAKKKQKADKDFTFEKHLREICEETAKVDTHDINTLITHSKRLIRSMSHISPLFYVIDYTQSSYRLMTDNILNIGGEKAEAFLEGGLAKLIEVYQKDDFKIYNERVFKNNRDFLQSVPVNRHHNYIFSYNFRAKHKKGHLVSLYQRGFYITSQDTGLPLFSIGTIQDISLFKRDMIMCHSIEEINSTGSDLLQQKFYLPDEKDRLVSPQERRVLQYIAEGKSSKQIADLLFISENTVITHRKNILRKTDTLNTAELIAYAIRKNII
ncbi:response regulator transcription factor [Elizabethkingia meningoseptica]|uniref:response regulator transcription factor n=1 Tax=Elizabethkingia meningoseptica TaxID=238 RepID=UPI003892AF56